jgi:hypothetical protein
MKTILMARLVELEKKVTVSESEDSRCNSFLDGLNTSAQLSN